MPHVSQSFSKILLTGASLILLCLSPSTPLFGQEQDGQKTESPQSNLTEPRLREAINELYAFANQFKIFYTHTKKIEQIQKLFEQVYSRGVHIIKDMNELEGH